MGLTKVEHDAHKRLGCCAFVAVCVTSAFIFPAIFAVYLPNADVMENWKLPVDGCDVVDSRGPYECGCSTDQYGVTTCNYCEDYKVEYVPNPADQPRGVAVNQVQYQWLIGKGRGSYKRGRNYPLCRYNPHDLTKLSLTPENPASAGFIVLVVFACFPFTLLLMCQVCE